MHDRYAYVLVERGGASIYGSLTHHLLQIQARFIGDAGGGGEDIASSVTSKPIDDDRRRLAFLAFYRDSNSLVMNLLGSDLDADEGLLLSSQLAPFPHFETRSRQRAMFTFLFILLLPARLPSLRLLTKFSKFPTKHLVFHSRRSPVTCTTVKKTIRGSPFSQRARLFHFPKNTKFLYGVPLRPPKLCNHV